MAAGQTLNDRMLAARHSLAGQGLAKAVCKATTEELMGPKRKHLDYLIRCTDEPNVSIPTLANLLLERTQSQNWITVFKSLVTIHHLMCYGNERFTQFLASSNANFQLSNFLDKSGVQGYDMSPFVRRYAKYLSEKSVSYRTVAFDFCKVKRGKDGGTLRSMSAEKLLKTLPTLQDQVDALIEFEATTQDLNNGVINAAFMLLFRDLIRLFACYNDGIINLLEKYFEMQKKLARDALDIYKKFLIRMDSVAEFLKVAEKFGIDKSDIPDLARAPSSLLEALESHLANLEGRKPGSNATTPTGAAGRLNVSAAVTALSSTSSAFGTSDANIDEKLQQQLLQEEEQAMAKYKEAAKGTNPFAAATAAPPPPASFAAGPAETPNILDMFGMSGEAAAAANDRAKASDDLLQLSGVNPFASVMSGGSANTAAAAAPAAPAGAGSSPFGGAAPVNANGYYGMQPAVTPSASFGSDNSFINVFGAPPMQGQGQFQGQMTQQSVMTPTGGMRTPQANTAVGANFFGDILQPQGGANGTNGHATDPATGKLVSGDLDASLANLTSNLNLASGGAKRSLGSSNSKSRGPPMNLNALNGNAQNGQNNGQNNGQTAHAQLPW